MEAAEGLETVRLDAHVMGMDSSVGRRDSIGMEAPHIVDVSLLRRVFEPAGFRRA